MIVRYILTGVGTPIHVTHHSCLRFYSVGMVHLRNESEPDYTWGRISPNVDQSIYVLVRFWRPNASVQRQMLLNANTICKRLPAVLRPPTTPRMYVRERWEYKEEERSKGYRRIATVRTTAYLEAE